MSEIIETAKPPEKPDPTAVLPAATLKLSSNHPMGRVKLEIQGEPARTFDAINALPAFPLTSPHKMIQLYEAKSDGSNGDMIGLLDDLNALSADGAALIRKLVRSSRMLPVITRIDTVIDEFYAFHWFVITDRGAHDFFTGSPREAIHHTTSGQLVIEDLSGNQYTIVSRASLDESSQRQLETAS